MMGKHGAHLYGTARAAVVVLSCMLSFCQVLLTGNICDSGMRCTQCSHSVLP